VEPLSAEWYCKELEFETFFDLHDSNALNSAKKDKLITDFRKLAIEEIKQMQKQD